MIRTKKILNLLLLIFILGSMGVAYSATLTCTSPFVAGQTGTCTLNVSDVPNLDSCVWSTANCTPWGQCENPSVTYSVPGNSCSNSTMKFNLLGKPDSYYNGYSSRVKVNVYYMDAGVKKLYSQLSSYQNVVLPDPPVTLNCPATLNPTQSGSCTATSNPAIGTVQSYTWSAPNAQITPNGSSANISYANPGDYVATVSVVSDVAKNYGGNTYFQTFTSTANINVPAPQITITSLNCPQNLWIGQTGTCTAAGWSSWGTVRFIWSSSGTITSNNDNATVKFNQSGQGTVTVTAYLVENPFISKQQSTQVNVNIPQINANVDCTNNVFPGQQATCTGSATTEWGTVGYSWTSTGSIAGNGNTANVYFQDVGPGNVTMTAYITEAPSVVRVTAIDVVTVSDPMVNVSLDCPGSLWITQNGTCSASGSTLYGNLMYTWTSSGNITGGVNNTATVSFPNSGTGTATVTAYMLEAPNVRVTKTSEIALNAPEITAQLNCPASLYIGEPGSCTVNANTSYGTLKYQWNSTGSLASNNSSAEVTFNAPGSGNVSVDVSIVELPNIKVSQNKDITIDSPQIEASLSCPQSLWIGEPGTCTVSASASWGTLQYEWTTSSGTITGNGNTATVAFGNSGEGAVSVKVSLAVLPAVKVTKNSPVTVNTPDITAQLNCPSEIWKNAVDTCTVNATTSWGNLQYEWTSTGTLIPQGNTASISFPEQGSKYVSVKVSVAEVPAANITATSNVFVNGYRKPVITMDGKKFVYIKDTEKYTIKDVYSPSGPADITWNIDGQDMGAGNEKTYTFNTVKKVIITVRARVQGSGDDPDGVGVATYNIYVSDYPTPVVSIIKPYLIFVDESVEMTSKVYVQSGLSRQLFGRWVMPDGSYRQGNVLTYSFTSSDPKIIKYEAWFEGYEDRIGSRTVKITPRQYIFPDFNIWTYANAAPVVPFYGIFKANGDMRYAIGKVITYNWDFGDGSPVYSTTRSRYARKEYIEPGQYNVTLRAVDSAGNVDIEVMPLSLRVPDPITLSIKKTFTNTYLKAPLGAFVTATKVGGHPRDKIIQYDWRLNNTPVSTRYAASIRMDNPGAYNLKLNINTLYGYSASASENVSVNPNQPPVCNFTWEDKPTYSVTYFYPSCSDSDGKISSYRWDFGNGQTSAMVKPYARFYATGSYTVKLTATDDSGAAVDVIKNVNIVR